LQDVRWIKIASATFAAAYLFARLLSTTLLFPSLPPALSQTFAVILQCVRYAFLVMSVYIFYRGLLRRDHANWIALCAVVLGAIGLFASELSRLGVPGIWFPFGVGVSRTEYTYFAFDAVLFIYLLQRLWRFAPPR